jgi:hypothetical protein
LQYASCSEAENLAVPLSICPKKRGLFFCGQKLLKGLKLTNVSVLNTGTMHILDGVCKIGQTCLNDSEFSEHPSTATSGAKQEQARAIILKDSNKCKVFCHVTK